MRSSRTTGIGGAKPVSNGAPAPLPAPRGPDGLLRLGRWIALAGAVALLVVHLANWYVLPEWQWRLDANQEGTVWTWASLVATAAVAFGALIGAVTAARHARRYFLLAAVCAFLSLDDMISIHEKLVEKLETALGLGETWDSVLWPAFYFPVIGLAALLLFQVGRSAAPAVRRTIFLGLGLLAAAVAAEILSAPWTEGPTTVHKIEGGFEEAMELGGWVLLATGLTVAVLQELLTGGGGSAPPDAARDDEALGLRVVEHAS